jgi:simple sugar transport system substrate-binding protein
MSQLIDAAVAKKPQGSSCLMPDYDALKDSLAKAKAANIPIITINSGSDHYKDVGRHHPHRPGRDHRRSGRGPEAG